MKFRLIDTGMNTPSMNMAIDEALLTSKLPVLRLYQWQPSGLSIGYFQHINQINRNFCGKNNIEIVRRLTGGNAVLHDDELTYSFIIDEKHMPESIIDSYKEISKGILKALIILNLNPNMNEAVQKGEKSAVCFSDPSWYEITVNNKKMVGSAQKRVDGKLLQHGAVLMNIDIEKYANCFNNCSENIIKTLRKRITSINEELGKKVHYTQLAEVMRKGFEQELNVQFITDKLSEQEKALAERLNKEKYSTEKWNYLR